MADWTPPPWAQLVAGKAWTDEKAAAAFENVIAIAEGAPGAPRLHIGALQRLTPGWVLRSSTESITAAYGPGGGSGAMRQTAFAFLQAGSVRVIVNRSIASGTCSFIRRRNASDVTLQNPTGTGDYSWIDVDVLPGDRLDLSLAISGGSGSGSITAYLKIHTNGEDLWPGAGWPVQGNTYNA